MNEQAGKASGTYRAHDAEIEIGFFQRQKAPGILLHFAELSNNVLKAGLHEKPQVGQMGLVAFAAQEKAADFLFQLLDSAA